MFEFTRIIAGMGLIALVGLAASCDRQSAPSYDNSKRAAAPAAAPAPQTTQSKETAPVKTGDQVVHTDEEWKKILTPEQYRVLREKGTERAFTGKYWDTKTPGVYKCAACGAVLFSSDAKFDSGCGWPSFDSMVAAGTVVEHTDTSFGKERTEVTCAKCGGHLGHVFDDGPTPTHLRYCINSASIELESGAAKAGEADAKPSGSKP